MHCRLQIYTQVHFPSFAVLHTETLTFQRATAKLEIGSEDKAMNLAAQCGVCLIYWILEKNSPHKERGSNPGRQIHASEHYPLLTETHFLTLI